ALAAGPRQSGGLARRRDVFVCDEFAHHVGPESGRILRWRDYRRFAASGIAGMISSTATLIVLSYFVSATALTRACRQQSCGKAANRKKSLETHSLAWL